MVTAKQAGRASCAPKCKQQTQSGEVQTSTFPVGSLVRITADKATGPWIVVGVIVEEKQGPVFVTYYRLERYLNGTPDVKIADAAAVALDNPDDSGNEVIVDSPLTDTPEFRVFKKTLGDNWVISDQIGRFFIRRTAGKWHADDSWHYLTSGELETKADAIQWCRSRTFSRHLLWRTVENSGAWHARYGAVTFIVELQLSKIGATYIGYDSRFSANDSAYSSPEFLELADAMRWCQSRAQHVLNGRDLMLDEIPF